MIRLRGKGVTYGEVWYGLTIMPPGRRRQVREQRVRTVFAGLPLEDVTRVVADTYVQVKATLRRLGLPIPEADLWIAATALAGGYVLVSRDSHFVHVPGLTVEDWSQP
jgi:predicted nucleic acid-binding protein